MLPVRPFFGSFFCFVQDATDEHNPGTSDIDEAGISDADLEKLIKGLEHGSSRSTPRSGAGRRGDLDEVKTWTPPACTFGFPSLQYGSRDMRRPCV